MRPTQVAVKSVCPTLDTQGVELLALMLKFNPADRISARQVQYIYNSTMIFVFQIPQGSQAFLVQRVERVQGQKGCTD